jgi:hypothetical protein
MAHGKVKIIGIVLLVLSLGYFSVSTATALSYIHPSSSDVYLKLYEKDNTFDMNIYFFYVHGTYTDTKEKYNLHPICLSIKVPITIPITKTDMVHANFLGKVKLVNEYSRIINPKNTITFILDSS